MLDPNRVLTKNVNICSYFRYVRCATLIVSVGGMPWRNTGVTHHHAQLGLPHKGRAIKGLVVFYLVGLGSMIFFRQAQGACSGPLLWSEWLSSSSTAKPP